MEGMGAQKGWEYFKEVILKVQELTIPKTWKMSQWRRRQVLLNRDLWLELRNKRKVYGLWNRGQATHEDCKYIVKLCREKIRKAKSQLELNLATKVKDTINISINTSAVRGGLERISIPCWMQRGTQ